MRNAADFRRTAVHEASHGVAAAILCQSVSYVSVRPGRTFHGIQVSDPAKLNFAGWDPFRPVSVQPAELRASVERRIIVSLAGDIGALHLGPTPESGYHAESADEQIAREAFARLGPRLAELIVENEVSTDPLPSDEENARGFALAFGGPEAGWHYLEMLRAEARALVIRYRSAIWRVADALERKAVLTGAEVDALVYPQRAAAPPNGRRPRE